MNIVFLDIKTNYKSGLINILFLSKYSKYVLLPVYVYCKLVSRVLSVLLGCSIPFSSDLGHSIFFVHGLYGVFISGKAKVGNNCTILHHVTIGSNIGSSEKYNAPLIGDNVFIGTGVKVIGNVRVGNDSMLGANALILRDVPSRSKVYAPVAVYKEQGV